ncbi:hypothetical protein A3Q56_01860 [Intoshia linei]|uniref:Tyrosine-protein kinase ephrin type A/B receptor-like domain-containing protein n=1 Tax=Intoshia linei TaxID=1819745 RepID=A0A177B7W6_9BILA|nr:hypothetical protein A3Q56_01860 [Intoshia linei]
MLKMFTNRGNFYVMSKSNICSPGYYCVEGSSVQVACPTGTYNPFPGITSVDSCQLCDQGYYCPSTGSTKVTNACTEGFYCKEGTSIPTDVCPKGYYCPKGSSVPVECNDGYYTSVTKQILCSSCPIGYYCDNSVNPVSDYTLFECPKVYIYFAGYYCPINTKYAKQFPCPIGFYGLTTKLKSIAECTKCPATFYCGETGISVPSTLCSAGYFCKLGAKTPNPSIDANANICTVGNYCEKGTSTPKKCPLGTFSNVVGLKDVYECLQCTPGKICSITGLTAPDKICGAGYYCSGGSSANLVVCKTGHYCPVGSSICTACPAGKFNKLTGKALLSDCLDCTAGSYCKHAGQSDVSGDCPAGFLCPSGTKDPEKNPCPIGFKCPTGSSVAIFCSAGTFTNTTMNFDCFPCPAGHVCQMSAPSTPIVKSYNPCPKGYYCPVGTGLAPIVCSAGTYSDNEYLFEASQCKPCPPGKYCSDTVPINPTGDCLAGYYCVKGATKSSTTTSIDCTKTESIGMCPIGHYCPAGSSAPSKCSSGTYQDLIKQTSCKPCPAGKACLIGTKLVSEFIECPIGHYCPIGTRYGTENPCPVGTYNALKNKGLLTDCIKCTKGNYCEGRGIGAVTGLCNAGYFCTLGATIQNPTDGTTGNICPTGYYCVQGSFEPKICDPGKYCAVNGLSAVTGSCASGYYCTNGAKSIKPTDGATGNICPVGKYCPEGSSIGTNCGIGTYQDMTGQSTVQSCKKCDAGYYCNSLGQSTTTGKCKEGYYCSLGSKIENSFICPIHHMCPLGSAIPIHCVKGEYQPTTGQKACVHCLAGKYCPGVITLVDFKIIDCPTGYYCPDSSHLPTPCPISTFGSSKNLKAKTDCSECTGGYACDEEGLSAPRVKCAAGYFCKKLADHITPTKDANANICPIGYYCVEGTTNPTKCPVGTYGPKTGLISLVSCSQCTGGYFCDVAGLDKAIKLCPKGYYCPSGAKIGTQFTCKAGHYCVEGSSDPTHCPLGTYSALTGNDNILKCIDCDAGKYCDSYGLIGPTGSCNSGYYCPTKSISPTQSICKIGMYCIVGSSAGTKCADGTFTSTIGQSVCFDCPAGYQCKSLSIIEGNEASTKSICPTGHYCPSKTGLTALECPEGTYNPLTGQSALNHCLPCLPGKYCTGTGLSSPTGNCDAGYYCTSSMSISKPVTVASSCKFGGKCRAGYYCPAASINELPCLAGTYSANPGSVSCTTCPAGTYCLISTVTPIICPAGYYCPIGTKTDKENPCPSGTFNSKTSSKTISDCIMCTAGFYCENVGRSAVTGPCGAGYYCETGSISKFPTNKHCTSGYFCPTQSSTKLICTAGKYCDINKLSIPSGDCSAGFYCNTGSESPYQNDCSISHYCIAGTSVPQKCPKGTFSDVTKLKAVDECTPCSPGYYCATEGLKNPTDKCKKGYYCTSKSSVSDPVDGVTGNICPKGYFCPLGSSAPIICQNGFYQNSLGQFECIKCPSGTFCTEYNGPISTPTIGTTHLCPTGFYCLENTGYSNEHPCPSGTFRKTTGASSSSECTTCTVGKYCQNIGLSDVEGACFEGYECKAGSTSPIPLAGKCSQGYYCPTTSLVPVKCAAGTYMHLTGMGKSTQCISCPAGRYCPIGSKTQDSLPLCKAGYICKTGATIDYPASNMGFSCPIGHYCLSGSIQPIQCKPGTYQDVVGQDKCKSCLIGHMCPVSGVSVPIDCPKGFYCIAGITDEMKPCPTGTYNDLINQSTSIACKTCPPKKYCDGEGLDQPTGDCESGYICASGSTTPKPKVLDLNGNQPCPVGMYCSKSSSVGIKCPIGTIRYNIGARAITDCYPCAAGYFCDTLGLSTLTGSCNKGYFCPSIDKTSTKEPSAYKCPTGHYCPSKSAQPIPCPPGTFQANVQSFQCVPCTEGYYCSESTTTPTKCPPYNYCIKGSSSPKLCEPGTYSLSSDSGLIDATKCKLCVIGKYCINGRITDNCSAGYYCVSKNSSPTPDNVKLPIIGSSCPFGYYCESGTIKPSVCPEGKVINKIGASHIDECDLCPAGKQCLLGVVLPIPCEVGNYCAYNVDMKKCPNSTYLGYTGATSILECKSCPSGYFCSTEGISDYSTYVCPIGSYCPIGTVQPYKCPKGTYRKLTKGKSISDCGMCDVGYYCPVIGASSLTLKCEYGDYCPVRTILPSNCPIGYYCPLTTVKIPCPIGKYCPERSESPIACPIGHYCQSVMDLKLDVEITNAHLILLHTPKLCPFGYSFKKIAKQTTLSNSCDPCQSGYYGNHTERLYCNPCKPGVVCPLLANNDDLSVSLESVNSFICPKDRSKVDKELRCKVYIPWSFFLY